MYLHAPAWKWLPILRYALAHTEQNHIKDRNNARATASLAPMVQATRKYHYRRPAHNKHDKCPTASDSTALLSMPVLVLALAVPIMPSRSRVCQGLYP